jgi:hypothetical protein
MAKDLTEWKQGYQSYLDNPPAEGSILRAYGGQMARLNVEVVEGKPPFVYGRAYVPSIAGAELGWFLQAVDAEQGHGWKCILLPKAREECLRRKGITEDVIQVKALKVVRYSQTKNSILCEVAEYGDEEAAA